MTTRSQRRKAAEELVSRDADTPITGDKSEENLIAGPSKSPRVQPENLDEIKTSLRKAIMSDLSKILAENREEMLRLLAPTTKIQNNHLNVENSDSETENAFPTITSTLVKNKATMRKNTPTVSRNTSNQIYSLSHRPVIQRKNKEVKAAHSRL